MLRAVLCLMLVAQAAGQKTILDDMTETGMEVPGLGKHKLPGPTMAVGLPDAKVKALVDGFVSDRPQFLGTAHNAPFRFDRTKDVRDKDDKLRAREFHLFFGAHGKIKDLDDHNMLNSLLGMKAGPKAKADKRDLDYLEDDALTKRKITPVKIPDGEERYALLNAELVDKVKLTGVVRTRKQWVGGSLVTTMDLDPRFANDPDYPNRWQKLNNNKLVGPTVPYAGFGGYVKATPVPGMKDVIFVEMHFVFSEPDEWFGGRNLIGSKLPAASQTNISNLRLKLAGKARK